MPKALYRHAFDAPTLLRDHPPQFSHGHKAALFQTAYPDGRASETTIEVSRWCGRG